jgi:2-methylisocitrate lyase-like PEP mutase family enzyme
MASAARLRELVHAPGCTLAPGAYDAWSARLIEQAGFEACYLGGYGAAASMLAMPDLSLITASQMADCAARVADAVSIPVIADADTGFGNLLNLRHTVRSYLRAGVAAIQIEDQDFPKRSGHLDGKSVVDRDQMIAKVKVIKDIVGDDLLVVARTDSRATDGLDEALARGTAYARAGADIVFVEAPLSRDELAQIGQAGETGTPMLANMTEGGKTPYLPAEELARLGFAIVIFPVTTLLAATRALQTTLGGLMRDGAVHPSALPGLADLNNISGVAEHLAYAARMSEQESSS